MINLDTFTNFYTEKGNDDDFFLYRNNYSVLERFGVWGTLDNSITPLKTKHTLYHGIDDNNIFDSQEEGIEISWNYNVLNLKLKDDFYKKIK